MAIGDIRPFDGNAHQANKDDDGPMFPHIARGAGDQHPEANDVQVKGERVNEENAQPEGEAEPEGNDPEGQAETEGQADPEEQPDPQADEGALPRVRRRVDVDSILEEIRLPGRPTTRSRTRLANFYGNFSFVSMLEPSKFNEAMKDSD